MRDCAPAWGAWAGSATATSRTADPERANRSLSEENRELGLSVRYPHASYGWTEQIGSLWQMAPARLAIERAAPALGQHSREILAEIGLAEGEIEALIADGVAIAR